MDLIENQAIGYFKDLISKFDFPVSLPFLQVQIEHNCPEDVQKFMNEHYAGENLFDFFDKYSNIFSVSKLGIVSIGASKSKKTTAIGEMSLGASKSETSTSKDEMSIEESNTEINKKKVRNIELEEEIMKHFHRFLQQCPFPMPSSILYNELKLLKKGTLEYIDTMYPGDTFELFFYRFPKIFNVSDTFSITLKNSSPINAHPVNFIRVPSATTSAYPSTEIEEEAVKFYEGVFFSRYTESVPYSNLHGHLGQATDNIRTYLKENYLGNGLLAFFQKHTNVFNVDSVGNVSLSLIDEVHRYFIIFLRTQPRVRYTKLRNHRIRTAYYHEVQDYIKTYCPGEKLLEFFEDSSSLYKVSKDGLVSLKQDYSLTDEWACSLLQDELSCGQMYGFINSLGPILIDHQIRPSEDAAIWWFYLSICISYNYNYTGINGYKITSVSLDFFFVWQLNDIINI